MRPDDTHLKLTRCEDTTSILESTRNNPVGGKVITFFRLFFATSIICRKQKNNVSSVKSLLYM